MKLIALLSSVIFSIRYVSLQTGNILRETDQSLPRRTVAAPRNHQLQSSFEFLKVIGILEVPNAYFHFSHSQCTECSGLVKALRFAPPAGAALRGLDKAFRAPVLLRFGKIERKKWEGITSNANRNCKTYILSAVAPTMLVILRVLCG
jgi:hypothetical protein